jgi:hypothetical protein
MRDLAHVGYNRRMAWQLRPVGHFGVAVKDPGHSARWWIETIGVARQFDFEDF